MIQLNVAVKMCTLRPYGFKVWSGRHILKLVRRARIDRTQ